MRTSSERIARHSNDWVRVTSASGSRTSWSWKLGTEGGSRSRHPVHNNNVGQFSIAQIAKSRIKREWRADGKSIGSQRRQIIASCGLFEWSCVPLNPSQAPATLLDQCGAPAASAASGTSIAKTHPLPGILRTRMSPLCARTAFRAIDSPRPRPERSVPRLCHRCEERRDARPVVVGRQRGRDRCLILLRNTVASRPNTSACWLRSSGKSVSVLGVSSRHAAEEARHATITTGGHGRRVER
jgi:hypothetical protein